MVEKKEVYLGNRPFSSLTVDEQEQVYMAARVLINDLLAQRNKVQADEAISQ